MEIRSSGGEPHISDQFSSYEAHFSMSRVMRSKQNIQVTIERLLVRPGDELRGIIMVYTDCQVQEMTFSVEIFHVNLIVGAKLLSLFRKECRLNKFPLQMRNISSINLL